MPILKGTVHTTLPRDEAFAYIADWSRQAEWDPNTISVKPLGEGGPEVGARYAMEVKLFGSRTGTMEYRITELEAPSRLVLVGEGTGLTAEDTITFSDSDEGTAVEYHADIKLNGLLRFAEPLFGRTFDGITQGVVKGMKRELDARASA
ncbi:MAG: SRPBCC family protein [Chloroflexota bacterium]|jgi:carbon monoxide dehydrogenase subunit G